MIGIAEYLRARSLRPNDPLISLCLGTSYLSQVMQKNTYNRHLVCLKAFTFMNQYVSLRLPGFKMDVSQNDHEMDEVVSIEDDLDPDETE
eukprot:COSAG02_NODE_1104_length_14560_cov_5.927322_4_plen_90_part_00